MSLTPITEEATISSISSISLINYYKPSDDFLTASAQIELYKADSTCLHLDKKECDAYVAMSDSDIFRHPYYSYPPLTDPGIEDALQQPELPVIYPDDGQELYLAMCREHKQCPVGMFYRNLLMPEISLKYYCVSSSQVRLMTAALAHNKCVKHLNLSDSFLDDDANFHLGEMLRNNSTLLELTLSGCRIGMSGLKRLGAGLKTNKYLKKLDLSGNCLGDEGGEFFARQVYYGIAIQEVNLSRNNLGMKTAAALTEALTHWNNITHLDLSWNKLFHQPSTAKLLRVLAESLVIQELNLSWNSLAGERVATEIADILPKLTFLNLSNNKLGTDDVIEPIASKLIKAKKLRTLDLSCNPLTPHDALNLLHRMLRPGVKLGSLLMDDVWVDKQFIKCLRNVKSMKSRQDFVVTYAGVLHDYTITDFDPRLLVLKRADFLTRQQRKKRVDIAIYFLSLCKEYTKAIPVKILIDRAKDDNVPLDDDLLYELSVAFPGPKSKKRGNMVDLNLVAEYMQRLWPNRRLPITETE